MFDRHLVPLVAAPLRLSARLLAPYVTATQVTVAGFVVGCLALPALATGRFGLALAFILCNRFCDGLDGALARRQGVSDGGGFLDISLDFIFYSLVPFGFVLADPAANGVAGAFLLSAFMGSGASFLAFASVAGKRGLTSITWPDKSLYYLGGLTEGSETIACFVVCCLFPQQFVVVAWVFGALCWLTAVGRLVWGYRMLR